jgi:transcriptional regulator with XRE-family HTH domain
LGELLGELGRAVAANIVSAQLMPIIVAGYLWIYHGIVAVLPVLIALSLCIAILRRRTIRPYIAGCSSKPSNMADMASYPRAYSHYTLEAVSLLGEQIRLGRRERRWTQAELAERVGIGVRTLNRVENGDARVTLGTAFELAALTGVTLFQADRERLSLELDRTRARSAVLGRVRRRKDEIDDAF